MKIMTLIAILGVVTLAMPANAGQHRGGGAVGGGHSVGTPAGGQGHAVPRSAGGGHVVAPYRAYGHLPYYYPFGWGYYGHLGTYGYLGYPGLWGYGGYYPYPYGYFGYPLYGYGGGYGSDGYGAAIGRIRIRNAPRDAQVFVDGSYAGVAGDYDGAFERLDVEAGPHRIEIRAPGLPADVIDVNVRPGQTITYRSR